MQRQRIERWRKIERKMKRKKDVPDDDDDAVEHVKSVRNVLVATVSQQFEQHFAGENGGKKHIRIFDRLRQLFWLIVILDAHAERVEQNGQQNHSLKVSMIDQCS